MRYLMLVLLFAGGCAAGPSPEELGQAEANWKRAVDTLYGKILRSADRYAASTEPADTVAIAIVSDCAIEIEDLTDTRIDLIVLKMGNSRDVNYQVRMKRPEKLEENRRTAFRDAVAAVMKAREQAAKPTPK